jgi:serine/threonine-protein kinase
VVIKQLLPELAADPELATMFLDEARLGAKLIHPNVVYTLDFGSEGGRAFIALEYLEGMSAGRLAARMRVLDPAGGLPLELAVAIVRDAARGLAAAHEARMPDGTPLNLVHRDVSPQNIVVTYGGEVKLVDFGIAHAAVRETRTRTGVVKGKYAYMAPEQVKGAAVDRRTDVFAAGIVLWELATGQRLFKRPSPVQTYKAVLRGVTRPPSQLDPRIDPALEATLLRALAVDPARRHPGAAALADELDAWLMARGLSATPPLLGSFLARWFGQEIERHRRRIADLRAGRADPGEPLAAETWPWDEDDEASASDRARAGPEERTVVAGGTRPRRRRIHPTLFGLLILAGLAAFAAGVAWLVRLLR